MILLLSGTVFLPIVSAILINMYTDDKHPGSGYVLSVCLVMQLAVGAVLIIRERQIREPAVVLMEAEDKCRELAAVKQEMTRRDEAYRMVRSAFDALNNQFCNMGESHTTFPDGLRPIVEKFTASMWTVLGCTSNQYTIEAYFESEPGFDAQSPSLSGHPMVFFSSPIAQPNQAIQLGNRHPAMLNWHAGVGRDTNEISHLPANFFRDGKRDPVLYFNRYADLTIPTQCQSGRLGLLVLTAEQELPFAANVLDTLDFLATIVSAYTTKHWDCVTQRAVFDQLKHETVVPLAIQRATYGAQETQQDVTDHLKRLVVENNILGGDPVPSSPHKVLTVAYSIGNTAATKSFKEHEPVELP
jgi:hypothetical protein